MNCELDEIGRNILEEVINSIQEEKSVEGKDILRKAIFKETIGSYDCLNIIRRIFPNVFYDIEVSIEGVLNELISLRTFTTKAFDRYILELAKIEDKAKREEQTLYTVLLKTAKIIQNFRNFLYSIFLNNRPFAYAICVLMLLKDLKKKEDEQLDISEAIVPIIWVNIVEKIYAEKYSLKMSRLFKISNKLKHIGENLSNYSKDIHDYVIEGNRNKLVGILRNVIEQTIGDVKYLGHNEINYLTEHLCSLQVLKELEKYEFTTVTVRHFEKYIKEIFSNLKILEYEIYSLLVRSEIPSIPSIVARIYISDEDKKGKEDFEMDIVVVNNSGTLVNVEVTSRQDERSIKNKIDKLIKLGKSGISSIIITTRESCNLIRKNLREEYELNDEQIKCVSCEQPYYKIIQAIQNIKQP